MVIYKFGVKKNEKGAHLFAPVHYDFGAHKT